MMTVCRLSDDLNVTEGGALSYHSTVQSWEFENVEH